MKPVKNVQSATLLAADDGVPRAGQLIGDRYRLDRPLERGAMGSVWRAEQVRLRAPVAVKFLDPSLIGDKEMHDRFIQEARSAAAVRSAHVVQVFDYGSEGGVPYIAMELLDGENLDARLGARGTLAPAELAKLFSELARGVGQAHAIGVIHRDLKPGNIFLAREGEHEVTKIVDFGIAKVKASALRLTQGIGTQLGTLLGTPQYMSPEQVRGAAIDHRTDLWALGVIACECLTGRCPFSGATIGDLTVQICTEKPPAPSSLGPVPAGFDQWFSKATHKNPNKRFQSAEEMSSRLLEVLAPAVLMAPGAARAGRFISLPSRSEVRLAYSAVVTWKGSMLAQLEHGYTAFRQLMLDLLQHLSAQWDAARRGLGRALESERLSFMRPIVERHGVFASVALLCCGILLLGLTSRSGEPRSPLPEAAKRPDAVTLGLQAVATPAAVDGTPSAPASAVPAAGAVPPDDPAAPVGPTAPAALISAPAASPRDADEPKAPEQRALPSAGTTLAGGAAPAAARRRNTAASASRDVQEAPSSRKTRAMAEAAARILDADELIAASKAPSNAKPEAPSAAKAAPSAASKAATRSQSSKPRPAKSSGSTQHPFDDRL